MPRPKIGAVSYLNTKPLVAGLETDASDYQLIFDLPSHLADKLSQGELDVALIPVIEAAANPDYTIVSDACIACQGPVWSVKLFSKVPIAEIKTLALDEGSRTSRALTRIFLANKFGIEPDCQLLPIDQDWTQTDCDAALVIGDRAMKTEAANFPISLDLGTAWHDWTGMPFVFAVWQLAPAPISNTSARYCPKLAIAASNASPRSRPTKPVAIIFRKQIACGTSTNSSITI